jgi:hypothetical protein
MSKAVVNGVANESDAPVKPKPPKSEVWSVRTSIAYALWFLKFAKWFKKERVAIFYQAIELLAKTSGYPVAPPPYVPPKPPRNAEERAAAQARWDRNDYLKNKAAKEKQAKLALTD